MKGVQGLIYSNGYISYLIWPKKQQKKNVLNDDKVPCMDVSNANTYWKLFLKLIYCTTVEDVF